MTPAELNIALFTQINSLPHFVWLDRAVLAITDFQQKEAGIALGAVFIYGAVSRKFRLCLATAILFLSFFFLNNLVDELKPMFNKPRPYDILPNVHLVGTKASSSSFPSSAAALGSLLFTFIYLAVRKHSAVWIALTVLLGVFRIYEGLHFPSDILCGWGLGFFTAWAAFFFYRWGCKRAGIL